MQTVKVHAVEAGLRLWMGAIPLPEPFDKFQHHRVAPHPLGKAFEIAERGLSTGIAARTLDVTMNPKRIRPVRLDRERAETVFRNQPFRQLRPDLVKFMGAVGG